MRRILAAAAVLALTIPGGVAHADPVAPQRCKDIPDQIGPFAGTKHICDNGNGTVTSCYNGPMPMWGGPCRDWPTSVVPPGFWD